MIWVCFSSKGVGCIIVADDNDLYAAEPWIFEDNPWSKSNQSTRLNGQGALQISIQSKNLWTILKIGSKISTNFKTKPL